MDYRYFVPLAATTNKHRIFDRRLGCGHDGLAIAVCEDADTAYRIVGLLNADEALRATGTHQSHLAERAAKGQTNL